MYEGQVVLIFRGEVFNYCEVFNVSNKDIWHIKGGIFHDEIGHYKKKCVDVKPIIDFSDNIFPKHMLNNMHLVHKAFY